MSKPIGFEATEEMYKRVDLLLGGVLQKYDVGVKIDADFSKGTIKIKIKEKKVKQ